MLKVTADFTIEFAWIMSKYAACTKDCIQELIATPSMKAHHSQKLSRLRRFWPRGPDGVKITVDMARVMVHNTSIYNYLELICICLSHEPN